MGLTTSTLVDFERAFGALLESAAVGRRGQKVPVRELDERVGAIGGRPAAADLIRDQANQADPAADVRNDVPFRLDDRIQAIAEQIPREKLIERFGRTRELYAGEVG